MQTSAGCAYLNGVKEISIPAGEGAGEGGKWFSQATVIH